MGRHWSEIYTTQKLGDHLIIERRDGKPIKAIWDVLQRIKSDSFGPGVTAIEIYPAENDVVNEVNRRHLWAVDENAIEPCNLKRRS